MTTGRFLKNGGACLLGVVLWWAVLASGGVVSGEPSGQPGAQQGSQQRSQKGSQQCSTGQQSQSQQGANESSSNNANGTQNGCGSTKPAKKPAPLFGGSLNIKRSTQSTDSTALGFNGVDPNGQVQQALMNASPSSDSLKKVQAMASYQPSAAELAEFQKQGDLTANNTKPGQGR